MQGLAGSGLYTVRAGDFNGDGKKDVAIQSRWENKISVMLGNGDGSFPQRSDYSVGAEPWDIALGDVTGDSRARHRRLQFGVQHAFDLASQGNGTFAEMD